MSVSIFSILADSNLKLKFYKIATFYHSNFFQTTFRSATSATTLVISECNIKADLKIPYTSFMYYIDKLKMKLLKKKFLGL